MAETSKREWRILGLEPRTHALSENWSIPAWTTRRTCKWRWKARSRAKQSKQQRQPGEGNENKWKQEVIRREKAETWERVVQIDKKVDHHEFKIQEHDKKFLDLESLVAELKSRPSMTRSQPGGLDVSQWLDELGRTARGFPGL